MAGADSSYLMPDDVMLAIFILLRGVDYICMRRVNKRICRLIDSNMRGFIRDNCQTIKTDSDPMIDINEFVCLARKCLIATSDMRKRSVRVQFVHKYLPIEVVMTLSGFFRTVTLGFGVLNMNVGVHSVMLPIAHTRRDAARTHVIEVAQEKRIECRHAYRQILAFIETYFPELHEFITVPFVVRF
jgi:hypothetical protein